MMNIRILVALLFSIFIFACNSNQEKNASDEGGELENDSLAEVKLPEYRALNPFTIDPDKPVNPQNLFQEVKAWNEAWEDKTVQVIAWMWGGAGQNSGYKTFTNPDNPGLVAMKSDITDEEMMKIGEFGGAEYVVLEGIANLDGSSIFLSNVEVLEPYTGDSLPKGQQISPEEAGKGTPYNPADIHQSMLAWQDREVTIEGIATLALKGNLIGFDDEAGNETVRAVTAEEFQQENTKPQHIILKGKINRFDEDEQTVSLYNCTRLN